MNFYCYSCTPRTTTSSATVPLALPTNPYQLEKFIKHTSPTGVYSINSVFDSTDYAKYRDYIVSAQASGCLQIDDNGRRNYIFYAGEKTGAQYHNGTFAMPSSGVVLVLSADAAKIHAFPSSHTPNTQVCCVCGKPVPSYPL